MRSEAQNQPARWTGPWKLLLLALAMVCTALNLWPLAHWERGMTPQTTGTLGAQVGPADHQGWQRITGLAGDSPFAAAGVRVGDALVFDRFGDGYNELMRNKTSKSLIC